LRCPARERAALAAGGNTRRADASAMKNPAPRSPQALPRIGYLESIRGLAALQVLLLHFFAAFAPDLVFTPLATAGIAGYIHMSPLYFLYDGYSAVYIFFALSGYVLTRSFERSLSQPFGQVLARIVRLGLPAVAATLFAALVMLVFGRPNAAAGELSGSAWFAGHWNTEVSFLAVARDGVVNALLLGYRDLPGVAFLAPWQQSVEQSFVGPLWTLSIEFYGSMIVLGLCWIVPRSRVLWWTVALVGAAFTIRSAYVCFFIGHLLASFDRAERPAPVSRLLPVFCIVFGVMLCVLAEVWQPQWLRSLCADPIWWLFPGQFAAMQQKTFGAILVLVGIIDLEIARKFLSKPWLVARSKLSFPLYLIHWPILFGPAAALFLLLNGVAGIELARLAAIVGGICLAFVGSGFFLAVDTRALELSRALRKRMSVPSVPDVANTEASRIVAAE
jgi:peptidoglycan/LPS O-acetylase OafA/YrhL